MYAHVIRDRERRGQSDSSKGTLISTRLLTEQHPGYGALETSEPEIAGIHDAASIYSDAFVYN